MSTTNLRNTATVLFFMLCWLLPVSAGAQTARSPLDPVMNLAQGPAAAAPAPPGVLRWYDPGLHPFTSVSEGCQAWLQSFRNYVNGLQKALNSKGPAMTVTSLPVTNTTGPAGEPAAICNYVLNTGQGQPQRTAIPLRSSCSSPAFKPDLKAPNGCVPINGSVAQTQPASAAKTPAAPTTAQAAQTANTAALFAQLLAARQAQATGNSSPAPASAAAPRPAPAAAPPAFAAQPGNGDPSVFAPGLGSFRGLDFVLTAYGCVRATATVLCDFDITKQAAMQVRAAQLWASLGLVDESGRITPRQTAYFVGPDGGRLPIAALSTSPVRLIMEFAGVSPQASTVSLVNGSNQIAAIPLDLMDPGQPEGTLPARSASPVVAASPAVATAPTQVTAQAPAAQPQPADAGQKTNALDKASQGVDKVNQGVDKANDIKNTGKGILDSLKSLKRSK